MITVMPGLVYWARIAFCVVLTDHLAGHPASMLHVVPELSSVSEQVMMSMLVFSSGSKTIRSVMLAGSDTSPASIHTSIFETTEVGMSESSNQHDCGYH